MTYLPPSSEQSASKFEQLTNTNPHINQKDEVTVKIQSTYHQESGMSERAKLKVRENAPSMRELLDITLMEKGEYEKTTKHWHDQNEVEVEGMSQSALNSLVLKAEEIGKKITFIKTVTVKITD